MVSNKIKQINFIAKMKKLFPDYDYSQVKYVNSKTSVTIICPVHGEFEIIPNIVLTYNRGCPECQGIQNHKMTTNHFILKAKQIHGDKFDYSKTEYKNMKTPVTIICHKHGEFQQLPQNHLRTNYCCPECNTQKKLTFEEVKKRIIQKHGDKYDFTNTIYVNTHTPIKFVCKVCGNENTQIPTQMMYGYGCKYCSKRFKTTEQFIIESKEIHNNFYDYSKVNYIGAKTPVIIICPVHGEFQQLPQNHTCHKMGCPKCAQKKLQDKQTSKQENLIYDFVKFILPKYKIIPNYRNNNFELDIYIPEIKLGIEYNGIYWHSNHHKSKDYHYHKKQLFESLGIRVLMIWENQTEESWREEIQNYIKQVSSNEIIEKPGLYDYDKIKEKYNEKI